MKKKKNNERSNNNRPLNRIESYSLQENYSFPSNCSYVNGETATTACLQLTQNITCK